jgi:diphthamide biosynthesis protein 2
VRYFICPLTRYDPQKKANIDPIYERLISLGYTNITKHPIPSIKPIIRPNTLPEQPLLPTMTPIPDTTLLLIADPKDTTTTLLTYHHLTHEIYTYSPMTNTLTLSTPATNLSLRRRYVGVQKARDAGTIGIIVGTLGKEGYLTLISQLRSLILQKGKKPYLLSLGKINPAKVANFSECEVFCIIACPESTIVDSRVWSPLIKLMRNTLNLLLHRMNCIWV